MGAAMDRARVVVAEEARDFPMAPSEAAELTDAILAALVDEMGLTEEVQVAGMRYRSHRGEEATEDSGPYPPEWRSKLDDLREVRGGRIEHRLVADWQEEA